MVKIIDSYENREVIANDKALNVVDYTKNSLRHFHKQLICGDEFDIWIN